MAVDGDGSCQAVLKVQAQDLIRLSPCQSGEDCLGLTRNGQTKSNISPNLFAFSVSWIPQIPLPWDSIGMSKGQVILFLSGTVFELLCYPMLGALNER